MATYSQRYTYKVDWFYDVRSAPGMDCLLFFVVLLPAYAADPELPVDKDRCDRNYRMRNYGLHICLTGYDESDFPKLALGGDTGNDAFCGHFYFWQERQYRLFQG